MKFQGKNSLYIFPDFHKYEKSDLARSIFRSRYDFSTNFYEFAKIRRKIERISEFVRKLMKISKSAYFEAKKMDFFFIANFVNFRSLSTNSYEILRFFTNSYEFLIQKSKKFNKNLRIRTKSYEFVRKMLKLMNQSTPVIKIILKT